MKYSNYKVHYRLHGEVFDFEKEIELPHWKAVLVLQQYILRMGRLGKTESVLDIGCGSGWILRTLANSGLLNLYGVDISRGQYMKQKEKDGLPVAFAEADAYFLPFREESMDVILMSEILEHLETPADAVGEAVRVLRKGGKFLITVPWREKIRHTLCIHCNRKTPINAHVQSFDFERVRKLLENEGLQITNISHLLNKALVLLRIHVLLSFLPLSLWLLVDRAVGLVSNRWTNICACAHRPL